MSKKFYITKRSNLLDCDGSAFHDSFEILETHDNLDDCKKEFKSLINCIDTEDIIEKHTIDHLSANNSTTLITEYRKIEIYKFLEREWIALEIIKSSRNPKKFNIIDGVKNFSGSVYNA
jgi:hypothetical protein